MSIRSTYSTASQVAMAAMEKKFEKQALKDRLKNEALEQRLRDMETTMSNVINGPSFTTVRGGRGGRGSRGGRGGRGGRGSGPGYLYLSLSSQVSPRTTKGQSGLRLVRSSMPRMADFGLGRQMMTLRKSTQAILIRERQRHSRFQGEKDFLRTAPTSKMRIKK